MHGLRVIAVALIWMVGIVHTADAESLQSLITTDDSLSSNGLTYSHFAASLDIPRADDGFGVDPVTGVYNPNWWQGLPGVNRNPYSYTSMMTLQSLDTSATPTGLATTRLALVGQADKPVHITLHLSYTVTGAILGVIADSVTRASLDDAGLLDGNHQIQMMSNTGSSYNFNTLLADSIRFAPPGTTFPFDTSIGSVSLVATQLQVSETINLEPHGFCAVGPPTPSNLGEGCNIVFHESISTTYVTASTVPEPDTYLMMLSGLIGGALIHRKKD